MFETVFNAIVDFFSGLWESLESIVFRDVALHVFPWVLPLRMIVMQSLLMVVAIAVESTVLHWELRQPYRKSIEYATFLSLFCVTVGWLAFFTVERLLPVQTKAELISYVFFDQWQISTNFLIVLLGLVVFFFSVFIKLQGLEFLDFIREEQDAAAIAMMEEQSKMPFSSSTGFSPSRRRSVSYSASNHRFKTILLANASSYSAIALILGLRWFFYSFR